jgi:hypothetical protein
MVACGGDEPKVETPPQPSATAEATPPAPTATAEATPPPTATADPTPPPPPPKPAKEKFAGKFVQDFSGEVQKNADEAAKKAAGKADKDGKKYNAAMEKAKAAAAENTLENTDKQLTWSLKGKAAHTVSFEVANSSENSLSLKLGKDGKKDLKGQAVDISFSDDNTFSMKDPFAKDPKKAVTLVFKRQ